MKHEGEVLLFMRGVNVLKGDLGNPGDRFINI